MPPPAPAGTYTAPTASVSSGSAASSSLGSRSSAHTALTRSSSRGAAMMAAAGDPSQRILRQQPTPPVKRPRGPVRSGDEYLYAPSKRYRTVRSQTGRLGLQKGLRHFSLKVCEKVEARNTTTYNEVASLLVKDLTDPETVGLDGNKVYDEKNVRRRVYDALNVLLAIGIISKEKKTIQWVGLPSGVFEDMRELAAEREERRERLGRKREYLAELLQELVCLKNLEALNTTPCPAGRALPEHRLHLPFVVVQTQTRGGSTAGEPNILIEITDDRRQAVFSFSDTFRIAEDKEIVRALGLAEISRWELDRLLPEHMASVYPAELVRESPDDGSAAATGGASAAAAAAASASVS